MPEKAGSEPVRLEFPCGATFGDSRFGNAARRSAGASAPWGCLEAGEAVLPAIHHNGVSIRSAGDDVALLNPAARFAIWPPCFFVTTSDAWKLATSRHQGM